MGFLGKIEKWMENRKEEKKFTNFLEKRRKNLSLTNYKCPSCGHHKAFKKNNVFKCTKCGYKSK